MRKSLENRGKIRKEPRPKGSATRRRMNEAVDLHLMDFEQRSVPLVFQENRRARRPALKYPPLRVLRFTGEALSEGVESHRIEGQTVRIYNVAKTVADCFKYRNKIGIDVALEALREAWRARRFSLDELDHYARICRVQRVMQPYIEGLVA